MTLQAVSVTHLVWLIVAMCKTLSVGNDRADHRNFKVWQNVDIEEV